MQAVLLRAAAVLPMAAMLGAYCAALAQQYSLAVSRGAAVDGSTLLLSARRALGCRGRPSLITLLSAGLSALAALPVVLEPSLTAAVRFGACTALLALGLVDARCGLLPDALTLPLMWAGLLAAWAGQGVALEDAVAGAALGYGGLRLVDLFYHLWRGRSGVGGGDMKLLAAVGAWAGWAPLAGVLLAASLGGVMVALLARLKGTRVESLAFGPFICIPSAAVILLDTDVQYLFI